MSEEVTTFPEITVESQDGTHQVISRLAAVSNIGGVYEQAYASLLVDDIRIDDDPTTYTTAAVSTKGWSALWMFVKIDSTLSPTDLRILAQFSIDGGNTWYDYEEGLWASLYWEDTDTATEILKAYLLPCGGVDQVRFVLTGTGTDAANYFDVNMVVRQFRGNFGVAHA
jgi:hypothetical protein